MLSWSAAFNAEALERALALDGTMIFMHSHGSPNPEFSGDDRNKERPLFGAFSPLVGTLPQARWSATGASDAKLANKKVAVICISGGGSHVVQ